MAGGTPAATTIAGHRPRIRIRTRTVHRPSGLPPPARSAAPRTAELQLGMGSLWGLGAWSCSGGYPGNRPSGLPPLARRQQPSVARSAWSCGKQGCGDHAARASGGLPPCFNDAPWERSPWIAKHALCKGALDRKDVVAQCRAWHVPPSALGRSGWGCGRCRDSRVAVRIREAIWWGKPHPTALQSPARSAPAFRFVRWGGPWPTEGARYR